MDRAWRGQGAEKRKFISYLRPKSRAGHIDPIQDERVFIL
jgi:hypothetical protein